MSLPSNSLEENIVIKAEDLSPIAVEKRRLSDDAEFEDGPSVSKNCRWGLEENSQQSFDCVSSSEVVKDPAQSLLFEKYFSIIEERIESKGKTTTRKEKLIAKCLNCGKVLTGILHVTSNFLRHLRLLHSEKYEEYEELKQKTRPSSSKQDHFDKHLFVFIVKNTLPISVIESDSFKALLNCANPKLTVPSSLSLENLMATTLQSASNSFKKIITSGGYFCATVNVRIMRDKTYFGYSVHWIDESLERKSLSLALKRFSRNNAFKSILSTIGKIREEYFPNNSNLIATIANNGCNFHKAFLDFGVTQDQFLIENEEESVTENESAYFLTNKMDEFLLRFIRSSSHTLKLIATTDFNQILQSKNPFHVCHKRVLTKCSKLWTKVSNQKLSTQAASILGCTLKRPVVTRWNSMYEAMKDLLSHKTKLPDLCKKLDVEEFEIRDFEYIAQYIELLQPLIEGIEFLQRDYSMKFGYLMPTLATIKTKYAKMQLKSRSNPYLRTMSTEIVCCINKRFESYVRLDPTVESAIVASVLCPAVKCRWIKALNPEFDAKTEIKVINLARDAVTAMSTEPIQILPDPPEDNISSYFNFSIAETSEEQQSSNKTLPSATEFLTYLADPSQSLSMLDKYPTVKKAFIKYNTLLLSTDATEKMFPFALMMEAPEFKHGTQLDDYFEKIWLLNVNNTL